MFGPHPLVGQLHDRRALWPNLAVWPQTRPEEAAAAAFVAELVEVGTPELQRAPRRASNT
eukprot:93010-Alexandrium_andersonii.AAC.1